MTFTKSKLTWESYFDKVEMIKGHVNNSGKLLAKLKDAEATASPWQQKAIRQIEPLLREMADNTTATIKHLNERKAYVHFPAFQNFVKANFELATDLEALTRDFVNYGNDKEKSESLGSQLEIGR